MAAKEAHAEPSMEEILASIRRIISEEEEVPTSAAAEPVLDLTEAAPADDDLMVFDDEPAPAPAPAPIPTAPPPRPARMTTAPEPELEPIVSEPAASAAAGALVRLAGSLRIAEQQGQTLEGVVRELLKPMLKDWLDRNLPAIVESRVEAELERIARLSR